MSLLPNDDSRIMLPDLSKDAAAVIQGYLFAVGIFLAGIVIYAAL